jgi:hypothetical protein
MPGSETDHTERATERTSVRSRLREGASEADVPAGDLADIHLQNTLALVGSADVRPRPRRSMRSASARGLRGTLRQWCPMRVGRTEHAPFCF